MKTPILLICCILFFNLQQANAQAADPAVTNIQTLQSSGCFDSSNTVVVTIENNGATIDFGINPLVVNLSVRHANGTITYSDTITFGLLQTNNSVFQIFQNINLYAGGCYFLNTTLLLVGGGNSNMANDSLSSAYIVCNSRPMPIDYFMNAGDTIPGGQGLSISNCPDSVLVPVTNFCFTGNIPSSPSSCQGTGAACFASVNLPTLPPGANITSGEIIVTNLGSNGFPSNIQSTRFCLYQGSIPITIPNLFHNGLVGIGASVFGPVTYHSFPAAADISSMYNGNIPVTPIVNIGHWSTSNCTSPNFIINNGGPTTAVLKIKYASPPGTKWYEQDTGGVSISDSAVLDPLNTPNNIVNNSSVPGVYTFYGACLSDTNCRVAVNLHISIPQNLNNTPNRLDDFIIYPNPTNKELTIKTDKSIEYTLKLVNVLGKTILQKKVNDKIVKIDLSDNPPGVYMLLLSAGKYKKNLKILIER